jgi:tRNA (guanine37-N1)-methyltransferase
LVLVDAVARFVPGVVKEKDSVEKDSFNEKGLLDYPCYTRPEKYQSKRVPQVLLSGNHREIELWRRKQSLLRTLKMRPDLLEHARLDSIDRKILEELKKQ